MSKPLRLCCLIAILLSAHACAGVLKRISEIEVPLEPTRPRTEIAVLRGTIRQIKGTGVDINYDAWGSHDLRVQLLPGEYVVYGGCAWGTTMAGVFTWNTRADPTPHRFLAEAGHRYELRTCSDQAGVLDEGTKKRVSQ